GRYGDRVRRSYHNLKGSDNLFRWRGHIIRRLSQIEDDPRILSLAASEMAELHGVDVEQGMTIVRERIETLREHIDAMPAILESIDDRNRRYSGLTHRRVSYILRQDDDFEAQ